MLLYVLCIELLGGKLRGNPNIEGIKLPNLEIQKVKQYADDLINLISKAKSLNYIYEDCELFGAASGSKVNKTKTTIFPLGKWKINYPRSIPRDVFSTSVKILGLPFGNEAGNIWEGILGKIETRLNQWKQRHLSMVGKKLILNTYVLSSLWYVGRIRGIPDNTLTKAERLMYDFLWHPRKNEMIKRSTLQKDYIQGGIGIINIRAKLDSFNLKKLQEAIKHPEKPWVSQIIYRLGYQLRDQVPKFGSNEYVHTFQKNHIYNMLANLINDIKTYFPNKNILEIRPPDLYTKKIGNNKPTIENSYPWVPWGQVYKSLISLKNYSPIKDTSYLLLHNALPTGERLQRFKMRAEYFCALCRKEDCIEDIPHLFIKCKKLKMIQERLHQLCGACHKMI